MHPNPPATAPKKSPVASQTDGPLLMVQSVGKIYRRKSWRGDQETVALDNISFTVANGEIVAIIGPSGCGKSTILHAVAGLTDYDSGEITMTGYRIVEPGVDRAVVFQHASLLPWRTVARNVAYGLELRRGFKQSEIATRVDHAIKMVGLSDFKNHYPHELSGGMQQRVNIARALAVEPMLILMDEPFGALDALTRETLQDQLSNLIAQVRRSTIFITHDITEAIYIADKILVMSRGPGRIIADFSVDFPRPRDRAVQETKKFEEMAHELRGLLRPVS